MDKRSPVGTTHARSKRRGLTIAESERIFNRLKRARPLCTESDIARIDHDLAYGPNARNRRAALMTLTRPGKFSIDWALRDGENAVAMADGVLAIRETVKAMRELADLLEIAEWRMAVALCSREDMQAVYAEAKAAGEKEDVTGASHG